MRASQAFHLLLSPSWCAVGAELSRAMGSAEGVIGIRG
jgi:hypothetical protein